MNRQTFQILLIALVLSTTITGLLTDFQFNNFTYVQAEYPGEGVKFYSIDAIFLWTLSFVIIVVLGLAYLRVKRKS